MDLSQVSTEDLMKMRAQAPDLSSIPTEVLMRARTQPQPDSLDQSMLAAQKPTGLERFGRGFADVAQGGKQLLLKGGEAVGLVPQGTEAAYTKDKSDELALYEKGRGKDAGIDWGRLAGNVVATLPAAAIPGGAAVGLGTRMAAGAAQGALSSSTMFTPEGESRLKNMLVGAAFGGAVPAVLTGAKNAIVSLVRKVQPSPEAIAGIATDLAQELKANGVEWSKLPAAIQQSLLSDAKAAVQAGGELQGEQLARKATIEAVGAKPTRAAVTRLPRDWQAEKNMRGMVGVGEPIVERESQNAQAMQNFLGALKGEGKSGTAYNVGTAVSDAVKAKAEKTGDEVSKLYGLARDAFGGQADLPRDTFAKSAVGILDDFEGIVPASIERKLQEFGITRMGVDKPTRAFTVEEGEKLIKSINRLYTGGRNAQADAALDALRGGLKDAVAGLGEEGNTAAQSFKTARAAAAQRFAEFGQKPVKALIEGKVAPEDVVDRMFINGSVNDVRSLVGTLKTSDGGTEALKSVKGAVIDHLLMKSTGASSADDLAGKAFSGVRFGKALDAIEPEKLHQLFTPSEIESLRTLQKASRLLTEEVPFSDVNHSKTVAALANLLQKAGNIPVLGEIAKPIIGAYSAGSKWMENANARKAVAEALLGRSNVAKPVPVYAAERFAPAIAAAAEPQISAGLSNDARGKK